MREEREIYQVKMREEREMRVLKKKKKKIYTIQLQYHLTFEMVL